MKAENTLYWANNGQMLWFWLRMEYASDLARGFLSKKRCLNAAFLSGFCSEMLEVGKKCKKFKKTGMILK